MLTNQAIAGWRPGRVLSTATARRRQGHLVWRQASWRLNEPRPRETSRHPVGGARRLANGTGRQTSLELARKRSLVVHASRAITERTPSCGVRAVSPRFDAAP